MLLAAGDVARRALLLLAFGLAPYAVPPGIRDCATSASALVGLGCAAALAASCGVIVYRSRGAPVFVLSLAGACVSAFVCAAVFKGAEGPVARGVWVVMPLEWVAVGAGVRRALARSGGRSSALPSTLLVTVAALVSLGLGWQRLSTRERMWSVEFERDPSDEHAALAVAASLDAAGRSADALTACIRCAAANPGACGCATEAGERGIRGGRVSEAVSALDSAAPWCQEGAGYIGLQADAWVRAGRASQGLKRAEEEIHRDRMDPRATFAVASALFALGDPVTAVHAAERAEALGYGNDATILVGIIDLSAGDPSRAAQSFRRVLDSDPKDPVATYDLALTAERLGHYREAREGYLATLQLDPSFVEARYNLAVLLFRAGARDEAMHALDELTRIAPGDPRLPELRRTLGAAH
jgi:Flp pilus assembly protein TadD